MKVTDFHIGLEFYMSGKLWRCTDVGSRVIIAIKVFDNPAFMNGPPYSIQETVIDEFDLQACSLTEEIS